MRAVAITRDRTLGSRDLQERPLHPHEARVDVAFCGICGSDIHFRASEAIPPGTVMGHEFSGTLSEVGDAVAQIRASFAYRREEFHEAVQLLAAGVVPGERLITGRAPLEAAQSMFERLEDPSTEDIKILLTPAVHRSDD